MVSSIREYNTDGVTINAIVEYFDGATMVYRGTTSVAPDGSVENVKALIDADILSNISRLEADKAKAEQCAWLVNELKTLIGA